MKEIVIYLILIMCLGCQNVSNILPATDLKYLEEYHCWPYNVNVYSIDEVKIDSLFYIYPLKSYYGDNPKYKTVTWTKYSEVDTTVWYGMDMTLKQCDDNTELYNQILKGSDIYYAGSYQYFKNLQGEQRRRYEKILFLDFSNNKLHIFNDVNKVY